MSVLVGVVRLFLLGAGVTSPRPSPSTGRRKRPLPGPVLQRRGPRRVEGGMEGIDGGGGEGEAGAGGGYAEAGALEVDGVRRRGRRGVCGPRPGGCSAGRGVCFRAMKSGSAVRRRTMAWRRAEWTPVLTALVLPRGASAPGHLPPRRLGRGVEVVMRGAGGMVLPYVLFMIGLLIVATSQLARPT